MRCTDCASPVADDQRYCLNCGAAARDVLRDLLRVRPSEPAAINPRRRPPLLHGRARAIAAALMQAPALTRLRRLPVPGPVRAAASGIAAAPPLAAVRRLGLRGGVRGAAAALVCALGLGILTGLLVESAPNGTASAARRVMVSPPPAALPAPPVATPAALGSLQAAVPPPAPPPVTVPPPAQAPPPPPQAPAPPPPPPPPASGMQRPAEKTSTGTADPQPPRAPVKHVVLVALADKGFTEAFGPTSQAPYLATQLRRQGVLLRRYHATAHGSLPNLTGLLSGQGANPDLAGGCPALTPFVVVAKPAQDGQVRGNGCVFPASVATLPAQLDAAKLAWHAYVEDADPPPDTPPAPCQPPPAAPDGTPAIVDRNPLLFFAAIAGAADCTARVTGFAPLAAALTSAPAQAPALSIILPNACHAGREGSCPAGEPDGIVRADTWLREVLPQLLAAPAYADDTMIVITFDQARATGPASDFASCCGQRRGVNEPESVDPQAPADGGGRVGALVLSPRITAGRVSDVPYNHFALLRTIERSFKLDLLGLAAADELKPFGRDVFDADAAR